MMQSETVGDRVKHLTCQELQKLALPRWPPDAFALCASLIMCSGVYSLVVDDKPLQGSPELSSARAKKIDLCGEEWRKAAVTNAAMPKQLNAWWKIVVKHTGLAISEISENRTLCEALLNLLSAADAASYDIGIFSEYPARPDRTETSAAFVRKAERRLLATLPEPQGSTLCLSIHQSRARVLPKMHTPQNGLTIRSFSHHLAFCLAPDVSPRWLSAGVRSESHAFNLLIVPWPTVIHPSQFQSSRKVSVSDQIEGGSYGLFTYKASGGPSPAFIEGLIRDATERVGQVDGIIFPELSMSEAEFDRIATRFRKDRLLVAGIGESARGPFKSGRNEG